MDKRASSSRRKHLRVVVIVTWGIIILGSFINYSPSLLSSPATTLHLDFFDDYALHLLMQERRRALVNESTAVRFHMIYSYFNTKAEEAQAKAWLSNTNESARDEYLQLFVDAERTDVISGDMCVSLTAFREAGGVKKHIYIGGRGVIIGVHCLLRYPTELSIGGSG